MAHMRQTGEDISKKLDETFIAYMLEVDARYKSLTKHERLRVEQWSKVLC